MFWKVLARVRASARDVGPYRVSVTGRMGVGPPEESNVSCSTRRTLHTTGERPTFLALIFFLPPLSHRPSTLRAQIWAFKIVFFSVDFMACALARSSANLRSRFCNRRFPRFSASIILSVLFFLAPPYTWYFLPWIFWYFFSFRCQCVASARAEELLPHLILRLDDGVEQVREAPVEFQVLPIFKLAIIEQIDLS